MAILEQQALDLDGLTDRQCEILDAAAQVFAEKGFAGADVQVIADRVGVGKGTVYRNFGTKDDLFLASVDREIHTLSLELIDRADAAATPLASLREAVYGYLEFFDARPWAVELVIIERANYRDRRVSTYIKYVETFRDYWEELVRRLIADGTFRQVPIRETYELFSDSLYGAIFTNHFAGHREPYVKKAPILYDALLNGLIIDREGNTVA
jgi:AcrR family transcriptional regulator